VPSRPSLHQVPPNLALPLATILRLGPPPEAAPEFSLSADFEPELRYKQEVNYSDMFTPATTKRNQRRSPLAAQNYRLTDGRTVLPPRVLVMNTAHYYQNTVLHNEPQLLPAIGEGRV